VQRSGGRPRCRTVHSAQCTGNRVSAQRTVHLTHPTALVHWCTVHLKQCSAPVGEVSKLRIPSSTVLHPRQHLHCTALHCTALHCTALHCESPPPPYSTPDSTCRPNSPRSYRPPAETLQPIAKRMLGQKQSYSPTSKISCPLVYVCVCVRRKFCMKIQ
jgi:hypothetical protein